VIQLVRPAVHPLRIFVIGEARSRPRVMQFTFLGFTG
jgi:hypothetical protein